MVIDNSANFKDTKAKLDYLKELLTDRSILTGDPRTYLHVEEILEKEILRIRSSLFSTYGVNPISDNELPEPEGPKVNLQTKVYMPPDSTNSFNFVGRILGPDGSTAKCLQQCLGVKIMVRGRGSMRDRRKEDSNVGKPNWEHLNDRLHVVLTVEDYENRAKSRLAKAGDYITLFLRESMKGSDKDDRVKQMQLMELSFRRESCPSWHFNCSNVLELAVPPKPNPLFSSSTNPYTFGYGYPPTAPLFSSLSHNPPLPPPALPHHHYHHHHFGQFGQPQHQQQQALTGPGLAQHNAATDFSYPFASSLNAATIFLGHTPPACQFSPGSHQSQCGPGPITSLPPGLTLNPVNYWAGQNLSQLSQDFQLGASQLTSIQSCVNGNASRSPDDSGPTSSLLSNACSSQAGTVIQPIGLSNQPTCTIRGFNEDPISHYVVAELAACSLGGSKGTVETTTTSSTTGTYGPIPADAHSNKIEISNNSLTVGVSGTGSSFNGTTKLHLPKHRFSQKQHCHSGHQLPAAPSQSVHIPGSSRGSGRSAVVTVKVGSNGPHSPKVNGTGCSNGTDTNGYVTEKKHMKSDFSNGSKCNTHTGKMIHSSSSVKHTDPLVTDSEVDWPKLGAVVHDKHVASLSLPSQPLSDPDLV